MRMDTICRTPPKCSLVNLLLFAPRWRTTRTTKATQRTTKAKEDAAEEGGQGERENKPRTASRREQGNNPAIVRLRRPRVVPLVMRAPFWVTAKGCALLL